MSKFVEMFGQQWPGMLLIAAAIGGAIAWYSTRDMRQKTSAAQAQMISVYEATLAAKDKLAEELRALNLQQLDTHQKLLLGMTHERDGYRDKSHKLSNDLQASTLTLKELESKPNITALFKAETEWHEKREEFYLKLSKSQERMVESQGLILELVQKGNAKLEEESAAHRVELREYSNVCHKTAEALDLLVTSLRSEGVLRNGNKPTQKKAKA